MFLYWPSLTRLEGRQQHMGCNGLSDRGKPLWYVGDLCGTLSCDFTDLSDALSSTVTVSSVYGIYGMPTMQIRARTKRSLDLLFISCS